MAVDALEYDESAEDANPAGALEEILENPERLKDLDLDAFAEELERQVSQCVCCSIFEQLEKKYVLQWRTLNIIRHCMFQKPVKQKETSEIFHKPLTKFQHHRFHLCFVPVGLRQQGDHSV